MDELEETHVVVVSKSELLEIKSDDDCDEELLLLSDDVVVVTSMVVLGEAISK
jgi:hypothetical protein